MAATNKIPFNEFLVENDLGENVSYACFNKHVKRRHWRRHSEMDRSGIDGEREGEWENHKRKQINTKNIILTNERQAGIMSGGVACNWTNVRCDEDAFYKILLFIFDLCSVVDMRRNIFTKWKYI